MQWVHQPSPPGNRTPPQHTHHLAGDPSPPGAPPAAAPATRPAAQLSAAWPGSSAPLDTRALPRWRGWTFSCVHNCHRGSSISGPRTDTRTRPGGRGASQSPFRPLGRHCGEGSPSGWPAPIACSREQGSRLRRQRGASRGGEGASQEILHLLWAQGWGKTLVWLL